MAQEAHLSAYLLQGANLIAQVVGRARGGGFCLPDGLPLTAGRLAPLVASPARWSDRPAPGS